MQEKLFWKQLYFGKKNLKKQFLMFSQIKSNNSKNFDKILVKI